MAQYGLSAGRASDTADGVDGTANIALRAQLLADPLQEIAAVWGQIIGRAVDAGEVNGDEMFPPDDEGAYGER